MMVHSSHAFFSISMGICKNSSNLHYIGVSHHTIMIKAPIFFQCPDRSYGRNYCSLSLVSNNHFYLGKNMWLHETLLEHSLHQYIWLYKQGKRGWGLFSCFSPQLIHSIWIPGSVKSRVVLLMWVFFVSGLLCWVEYTMLHITNL